MLPEASPFPAVPVQVECPAGRILTGSITQSRGQQPLECRAGQAYCQVACEVRSIIFKRSFDTGEEVARGFVGGYCILQGAGFVQFPAVLTAPPPPEPVDPDMPF